MHTAATDIVRITQRRVAHYGGFILGFSEGLWMTLAPIPFELKIMLDRPFIVREIGCLQMGSLLQDYYRKSSHRQFLRHDATGGTGTHNDEIDGFSAWVGRRKLKRLGHAYSPFSA